jgi:selenide,water dikinase
MVGGSARAHEIVLLGAGHTHLHVIKHWRSSGSVRARITCVSDFATSAYSGLLPAVLAGQQPPSAMEIDLAALCRASGARLIVGQVTAVDVGERRLTLADGRVVPFDTLSVGVGSVPRFDGVDVSPDAPVIPIKPMQTLMRRLRAASERIASRGKDSIRVVTVGGGAGGIEVTLCVPHVLESVLGTIRPIDRSLVNAGSFLSGSGAGLVRRARRALDRAGVTVIDKRVTAVRSDRLVLADGSETAADLVLWVTGAAPTPVLETITLAKDSRGFLETTASMQSASDPAVFAVGDAGTQREGPGAKAGVYAVRQGPVLLDNLRRVVRGAGLRPFTPQPTFMKLLNTGDGRAMGEWRNVSFEGTWVLRMKMAIDLRFVARYQFPP